MVVVQSQKSRADLLGNDLSNRCRIFFLWLTKQNCPCQKYGFYTSEKVPSDIGEKLKTAMGREIGSLSFLECINRRSGKERESQEMSFL